MYLLNEKLEFIPSDDVKCPKSGLLTLYCMNQPPGRVHFDAKIDINSCSTELTNYWVG